ncbi:MAG: carbamoyltransferase HypF, partial [Planctomycetota bacterium]|nr:carbamoyltransferase HypF [Planctomycetota bacterium]
DSIQIIEREWDEPCPADFEIRASVDQSAPRPTIPADLATCGECLAEIRDPHQRRYRYAFTNCTHCGPRWSIIRGLPYDRPLTSMQPFEMCAACRGEYENPADRRFHAQPVACPACGPKLRLLEPDGLPIAEKDAAMQAAAEMIRAGRIVAVKGLGGFQLVVDATNQAAVERLRARKHRPHKPLALLVASTDAARACCTVGEEEQRLLESAAAPIVLLRRRGRNDIIAEGVAPGNPYLGLMLPCTPLHHLLVDTVGRPVVCTSGNFSEEPMATTTAEAMSRLGTIADALLVHNRVIVRPVDDSVAQYDGHAPRILRRARGYAPLPIEIASHESDDTPRTEATVLAVGGHLKNTVALKLDRQVVVGAHVGDLDNIESVEVHRRAVDDLLNFFQVVPDVVACDLHPDYASTRHAESLAQRWGAELIRVQHHHAHVASCVAEHGLIGPVLGLAWDGTGFGPDKTIWGGEAFLMTLEDEKLDFTRFAHLRTFGLPGGDRAARQPRRSALGAMFELDQAQAQRFASRWFEPEQLQPLMTMLDSGAHCPRTSSMGRLFDAVAAFCDLPTERDGRPRAQISFEGQAAMALQFAAHEKHTESYEFPLSDEQPAVADWGPVLLRVLEDLAAGLPAGIISARFHNGLADLALQIAQRAGCSQIVLSGGCFQNVLLSRLVRNRLIKAGFNVYTHGKVPPGDGGIALGQAFIAAVGQCPTSNS